MQKIMFNEQYGLETAVLQLRKSMTRRVIRVPDIWHGIEVHAVAPAVDKRSLLLYDAGGNLIRDAKTHLFGQIMPKFKVGEIVAVAQAYEDLDRVLSSRNWKRTDSLYDAYYHARQFGYVHDALPGWSNKMYVRADLMPHQILITGCHCEPLQDISDEDCLREGICFVNGHFYVGYRETTGQYIWLDGDTPRESFATLINKTSGKHTWNDNPYTFVYEFKLVR